MSKTTRGVAIAIVLTIVAAGTFLYKYHVDRAAWTEVQEKLLRLLSGLQYEPILAVRSHLADTDAAVKNFASEWRIFPPDHERRVDETEKAVFYLDLALNWEMKDVTRDGSAINADDLQELSKYADVTTFVPRSCRSGRLSVDGQSVSAAFATEGRVLVQRVEYPSASNDPQLPLAGTYKPFDIDRETIECQQAEIEAQKTTAQKIKEEEVQRDTERKKYWAQWRYHVELRIDSTCKFDLFVDGKHTILQNSDRASAFGSNASVTMENVHCGMRPPQAIEVNVNGQQYQPNWKVDWNSSTKGYRATIVPMQP
jgi:hypothetical protein